MSKKASLFFFLLNGPSMSSGSSYFSFWWAPTWDLWSMSFLDMASDPSSFVGLKQGPVRPNMHLSHCNHVAIFRSVNKPPTMFLRYGLIFRTHLMIGFGSRLVTCWVPSIGYSHDPLTTPYSVGSTPE